MHNHLRYLSLAMALASTIVNAVPTHVHAQNMTEKGGQPLDANPNARVSEHSQKAPQTHMKKTSNPETLPHFDKSNRAVISKITSIAFEAARSDDIKTIDAYLHEGFSYDIRSESNDTLLSVAAYNGSKKVVIRLLKEKGINVDAPGRMGLTALAAASFKGETEIVRELLAAGANANAVNGQGQTALMFAALTGKVEAVRLLLKAGADPRRVDSAGNNAASLASKQGASRVMALLPSP